MKFDQDEVKGDYYYGGENVSNYGKIRLYSYILILVFVILEEIF